MIVKAINGDTLVVYQIPGEEDIANAALIVQRDAGGTIVISQEDAEIVINPNRANVKQISAGLQRAIELCEAAEERKTS
jgi:hypothetical protein